MINFSRVRHTAVLQAQRHLHTDPLFFDTETTGVHSSAEIIEIGIVDAEGQTLLKSFVRPRRPIPADATAVHGITNRMVMDAPSWPELWPRVRQIFAGQEVGIYNADFDLRMMRQSHALHSLAWEPVGGRAFCVMKLYARFFGETHRRGGFRWQSLKKAGAQCGIPLPNSHRAVDDARLTGALLRHMAEADA